MYAPLVQIGAGATDELLRGADDTSLTTAELLRRTNDTILDFALSRGARMLET